MRGRRSFGPVLLLGLAGGALAAVGGARPWASIGDVDGPDGIIVGLSYTDTGEMPVAGALALVALACWGVLLVTRGPVRRVVALLTAVASAGILAAIVVGWSQTADQFHDQVAAYDVAVEVTHTGWWWATLAGALLCLAAAVLAVRLTPQWPEMGRRYDAPGAAAVSEHLDVAPEERSSLELWKALDEGHDPTERRADDQGP